MNIYLEMAIYNFVCSLIALVIIGVLIHFQLKSTKKELRSDIAKKNETFDKIKESIKSCKTEEQLDCCIDMINNFEDSWYDNDLTCDLWDKFNKKLFRINKY